MASFTKEAFLVGKVDLVTVKSRIPQAWWGGATWL